ncbi:MAG: site-specific DNA-methyltransferase, partial [Candidatus Pacebacteria bacterium]|nr:site-specific DNA-methyltransferase [Candidatus Paceibacterota bacterium]
SGFLGAKDLKLEFNTRKPEHLLKRIILASSNPNDIILDFCMGSGTTCAVAHKMKRQYIGIEQMEYIENIALLRLCEVIKGEQKGISKDVDWQGGGDFVYMELAKWNEEAKEKIENCKNLKELEKLFDELYEKYFLNYNVKIKEFKEKIIKEEKFKELSLEKQKKMFLNMLDLNQMYIQKSEMSDKKFGISEKDQKLTEEFYKNI